MDKIRTRLGDGSFIELTESELRQDLEDGTQDAATRAEIDTLAEDELGHLAVGVHISGNPEGEYVIHQGKRYYYCETTTTGYVVGELPPDVEGKPDNIITI